ncbi:MAG: class II fructose-bisphosphate aldolase [Candidatus Kerfeldbacteria bacterium]|nr:class II fructose-bisphosphate aldolase [Candidatus Kerfeldbacteria bacterium]
MLATLQSVLRKAQRGRYAVGAFNVSNLEHIQAVVAAAADLRSPAIINTSEKAIAYAGHADLAAIVRSLAKQVRVPLVLNLDHGRSYLAADQCLRHGWTGIMFDGSKLSYEQNVAVTTRVKRRAARFQIGTEGEIGQVKYKEDLAKSAVPVLATPDQAVDFVRRTKVDALAVGIGNSHGLPVPGERLHFGLLKRIRAAVNVPLVLHGASGTSPASIRRAVQLGICKINIDTDLRLAFTRAVRRVLRDRSVYDPREYLISGRQEMMEVVKQKMILFGSRGKG